MLVDLYITIYTYEALAKDLQKSWKEELSMAVLPYLAILLWNYGSQSLSTKGVSNLETLGFQYPYIGVEWLCKHPRYPFVWQLCIYLPLHCLGTLNLFGRANLQGFDSTQIAFTH